MQTTPGTPFAARGDDVAARTRPERVDGRALRAAVDREVAETRRIDTLLRHRLGRYHSVCVDCSD